MAMHLRFTLRNTLIRLLKKGCEKHGFNISTGKISDTINEKGKKRQLRFFTKRLHLIGKKVKNAYPTKIRSPLIISKAEHIYIYARLINDSLCFKANQN